MRSLGRRVLIVPVLICALAPGCGGAGGPREAPASEGQSVAPIDPYALGSCEVLMSGDESIAFRSPGGPTAVGTDYWSSPEEIRETLRVLTEDDLTVPAAEVPGRVEAQMAQDPRLLLLTITCTSPEASIAIVPAAGTTYADVPFGPSRYTIAPVDVPLEDGPKGSFVVMLGIGDRRYRPIAPGVLEISAFDAAGITGSFAFDAQQAGTADAPRKLTVRGTFDFRTR